MTILITGIQGFVGSNLVDALKGQHELYGLDIDLSPIDGVKDIYEWSRISSLPEVDVVIHLAGKAHDVNNKALAEEYFQVNTKLTQQIFDWFLTTKAKKFIFFSSVKAVANSVPDVMLTEDVMPQPVGPYAESKRKAEEYILSRFDVNKHPERVNKFVYILRPSMIHGKGNKGNLNLLYAFVRKGFAWPLGAFENKRSFTSVANLIFIVSALIEKNVQSGVYHVSDDEALSTTEIILIISEVLSKPIKILHIHPSVIRWAARIGTMLHLPFNSSRLNKLTENYIVSNNKIKQALQIEILPVRAVDGMKKTIKSFSL